jgi:DNA-binding NarL/FixJ family response regulator
MANPDANPIQVAVIDDHPLFREGVATTLAASPKIEVVGQGASAEDAFRIARDLLPDILLLDVSMEGGGIAVAGRIAAAYPIVKIVMLTASEREEDVLGSLKAGARGYILKGVTARELVRAVEDVYSGEAYVTPKLAASLLLEMREPSQATTKEPELLDELTEREAQILERLSAGLTNKEIARDLGLREKTVKHYMTNILQKLQVRNRVEAALLAQKAAKKGGE